MPTTRLILLIALTALGGCAMPSERGVVADGVFAQTRLASIRIGPSQCNDADGLVYVSSYYTSGSVYVYPEKGVGQRPCAVIGTFIKGEQFRAWGLFVDGSHNLWATNPAQGDVWEFEKGTFEPIRRLSNPYGWGQSIVVDSKGVAYVAEENLYVAVYDPGFDSPRRVLSDAHMSVPDYLALDNEDNLYVSGDETIYEFFRGLPPAKDLKLFMYAPTGIATTRGGALAACDGTRSQCGLFHRGSRALTDTFNPPFGYDIGELALTADNRRAFVSSGGGGAFEYAWPRPSGSEIQFLKSGDAHGVAVSPPMPPGDPYRGKP
jgi:hypothetical protein